MFVGRREELATLARELEHVRKATPRTVIIEGPAGIGKSALVSRFLESVPDAVRLTSSGDEDETALPFGVLAQLLAPLDDLPDELRRLGPSDEIITPHAAGSALLSVLGPLQDRGAVVVVVEDAHWSDDNSLRALAFALRRLQHDRVLSVFTCRDGDDGARLPPGLRRLAAGDAGTTVVLSGLSADDLLELGRAAHGPAWRPAAARRLHEHTLGNPLYAGSVLREATSEDLQRLELPVPRMMHAVAFAKLAQCSEDAERLVAGAAVLGSNVRLHDAAAVGDVSEPLEAVDEAVAAGLLTVDALHIAFAHPLVRAAVYGDLAPSRRAALHSRAADVVEDPIAMLRHRVGAAHEPDGELYRDLDAAAHTQADRRAWAVAAQLLLWASEVAPDRASAERAVLRAAGCHIVPGDNAEAKAIMARTEGFEDTVLLRHCRGTMAIRAETLEEACRLLDSAWADVDPDRDPELAVQIAATRAAAEVATGRFGLVAEWARLALDLPASPTTSAPIATLCVGLGLTGRAGEALELLDGPYRALAATPEGLGGRGHTRLVTDDVRGAAADLEHACRAGRDHSPFFVWCMAQVHLAGAYFRLGRWDDSEEVARRLLSTVDDQEGETLVASACAALASVLALRGEFDEAELLRKRMAQSPVFLANAMMDGARIAMARGDDEGVVAALQPLHALSSAMPVLAEPGSFQWHWMYGRSLAKTGRLEEAEQLRGALADIAEARDLTSGRAGVLYVAGLVSAASGRSGESAELLEKAAHAYAAAGYAFERALALSDRGTILARANRAREAQASRMDALQAFDALRARPFADAERAVLGRRRPAGPRHADLTTHESGVARLVAAGLSNKEVAARLVVSVKTVEYHLRNVYAKLGVTSRVQLATKLAGSRFAEVSR